MGGLHRSQHLSVKRGYESSQKEITEKALGALRMKASVKQGFAMVVRTSFDMVVVP